MLVLIRKIMFELTLLLYVSLAVAVKEAFITYNDKEFVGPDKRLLQQLAKRRVMTREDNSSYLQLVSQIKEQSKSAPDSDVRRQIQSIYVVLGLPVVNDTELTAPVSVITKLMRNFIHNIESTMKELEPLVRKYGGDVRLRHGNVMCGLDLWKDDIMAKVARVGTHGPKLSIALHASLYQQMLARNLDIHHVVDYLVMGDSIFEEHDPTSPAPTPQPKEMEEAEAVAA